MRLLGLHWLGCCTELDCAPVGFWYCVLYIRGKITGKLYVLPDALVRECIDVALTRANNARDKYTVYGYNDERAKSAGLESPYVGLPSGNLIEESADGGGKTLAITYLDLRHIVADLCKNKFEQDGKPISGTDLNKILARAQKTNTIFNRDPKTKEYLPNNELKLHDETSTFRPKVYDAGGEFIKDGVPKGISHRMEALLENLMLKYGTDPAPEVLASFVGDGKVHTDHEGDDADKADAKDIKQKLAQMEMNLADMMTQLRIESSHSADANAMDLAKEAGEAFAVGRFDNATRLYHDAMMLNPDNEDYEIRYKEAGERHDHDAHNTHHYSRTSSYGRIV